ncbi:uncharacterized protein LOC111248147 isoform X2 [Varroa destructor]|uniref:Uncharacterized protein n=1 Tax=Varroa destructor TaxID=109461 RepID=A0A7M7JU56_VARDE|nr:uncharacterized protein LOC111248147 isoform X2 [Varroa destructor]
MSREGITMMLCDDRVRQQLHHLSIGTTYNQREDNHIDHGMGMQGSRRSSDLALNHTDMFDRERFNRRTSSIATVEQFEAHLDSTNSTGTKASNRTLATAAYIGLLTIIISFVSAIILLISFGTAEWEYLLLDREGLLNMSAGAALPENVLAVTAANWSDHVVQVEVKIVEKAEPENPNSETRQKNKTTYLVNLQAGIYQACAILPDEDRLYAERIEAFPSCVSYLALSEDLNRKQLLDVHPWLEKMRNLAISCSLVTLILVASTILLGAFGLLFKQLSALMVTGVLFLMAGIFGIFTYYFMIFRRTHIQGAHTGTPYDRFLLPSTVTECSLLSRFRHYEGGWAAQLASVGILLCFVSAAMWLLLARCLIRCVFVYICIY